MFAVLHGLYSHNKRVALNKLMVFHQIGLFEVRLTVELEFILITHLTRLQ